MKTNAFKPLVAALSCIAVLSLAGCGKPDHADLLGVQLGMTEANVKAVAPSGAYLYCRGDGDEAFDRTSGMPVSTSLRFCTWVTTDATGMRVKFPVQIGPDASWNAVLTFDNQSDQLKSFEVVIGGNAYDRIVKSFSDKLGSPESNDGITSLESVHWDAKDGRLMAIKDLQHSFLTELVLMRPAHNG